MPARSRGVRIVWKFIIEPERKDEFEEHYHPQGSWARLFADADGYRGTEMLRSSEQDGEYLVIDHWESLAHFRRFRERFSSAYEELDRACEELTVEGAKIGIFSEE